MMTSQRQFMGASYAALLQPVEASQKIRAAREAAIALLIPADKELQHGLELHANSLVIEACGFSPRSAIDGDRDASGHRSRLDRQLAPATEAFPQLQELPAGVRHQFFGSKTHRQSAGWQPGWQPARRISSCPTKTIAGFHRL